MDKLNIQNCIHVTRNVKKPLKQELIGTFKFVDNTLYFFDIFSMEWEEYDHSFNILTKKEFREVMKNWRFNYG
tara:strand:+ start:315 stop:533 length:219 start_codon:yes stop_codon:yes gene_type:complete